MPRRAAALLWMFAAWLVMAPGRASAQDGLIDGLSAVLDTNVSSVSTTVTDKQTGGVTTSHASTLFPRLTVNATTLLYPSLRLTTGGVFEMNALFTPGGDSSVTRLRPFFDLRSTNQIFAPGFSYYRRENKTTLSGRPGLDLVSEDYVGYLAWRPEGLPRTEFQLVRTNMFDAKRQFTDETRYLGSILSRYNYKGLSAMYQGSSIDITDRANLLDTSQASNGGKVDYSQSFLNRRLHWTATYNMNHLSVTTTARGNGGEVAIPVIPTAGLSSLSDTPVTSKLTSNPLLIDANQAASAGLNLGLPQPGSDARARNIGLDFLNPTEVNRLWVWIDRDIPPEIANSFSWEVYSSPDNLLWTREAVVSEATFGPFDNRFQLDFLSVTARYLKVVVAPLAATLPDASRFPEIFVTEVQPYLVKAAGNIAREFRSTTENLNTDVRFRILDAPGLYYEGSYWFSGSQPTGTDRQQVSNGVSVSHQFNPVVAAYGRIAFEQGTQPEGYREATVTNATVSFDPISTFTGSILYTGQDETIDHRPNDRRGLSIQTNSRVYRGVDVQFGFGWNFATRETGEQLHDRFVDLIATVTPRSNVTLTFNYSGTTTTREGTFGGEPQLHSRRFYTTLAIDPVRTLHLVVTQDVLATEDQQTKNFTNINLNWAPFPDGTLQFYFAYNESLRPLAFGTERDLQPGVRWRFARRSWVNAYYQKFRTDFDFERTESDILAADVRLFF